MATDKPIPTGKADADIAALIASGAAGVETAMKALEIGEHAYFGAVAATEAQPVVTITAVTPCSYDHLPE